MNDEVIRMKLTEWLNEAAAIMRTRPVKPSPPDTGTIGAPEPTPVRAKSPSFFSSLFSSSSKKTAPKQEKKGLSSATPIESAATAGSNGSLKLLYRASRDGATTDAFHRLCDKQGATLCLMKSKHKPNIFGGFTNIEWYYILCPVFPLVCEPRPMRAEDCGLLMLLVW